MKKRPVPNDRERAKNAQPEPVGDQAQTKAQQEVR